MDRKHCNLQCFGERCLAKGLNHCYNMGRNTVIYSILEKVWQEGFCNCYNTLRKHCSFTVFLGKPCGQKAGAIVKAWVENIVIYSVLEQVVWQEGLKHCFSIGRKHCKFTVFWSKLFGQKACTTVTTWVENTVIYSVLEQVVLNHCYYMGRKHCNLQCFGASCLARRLAPQLQYR